MDEGDLNIPRTYVLRNSSEVNHFYDQFVHLIKMYEPNLNPEQVDHVVQNQFARWFQQIVSTLLTLYFGMSIVLQTKFKLLIMCRLGTSFLMVWRMLTF